MGEAARRAKNDPTFGRIPKSVTHKRGLVISPPWQVDDNGELTVRKNWLDAQYLRASLLFFDDLMLPQHEMVRLEPSIEEQFLKEAGILKDDLVPVFGEPDFMKATGNIQLRSFKNLDNKEPGRWSLAAPHSSYGWEELPDGTADGFHLDLLSCIPVPAEDVPLAEILEFKLRRQSEIFALRGELDSFGAKIAAAASLNDELEKSSAYIQKACVDLLKAGKEWKFPIRISDAKCSFEANLGQLAGAVGLGSIVGQPFAMPEVGALIGGALSLFKISGDFKLQPISPRSSPYQYVYSYHNELY